MRVVADGPFAASLSTMIDVPYIEQVHELFRTEVLDLDFTPGEESIEVRLFREVKIPWHVFGS